MEKIINAGVGKILVFAIILPIEILFGMGMYLVLSASVASVVGDTAASVVAIFGGAFTAAGGMWAFMFAEYAIADVRAYAKAHNESNVRAWCIHLLQVLFVGLDAMALCYRLQFVPKEGIFWIAGVGVVFLFIPPVLGMITYAMANKPLEKVMQESLQKTTNKVAQNLSTITETMNLEDQLRYLAGDATVVRKYIVAQKAPVSDVTDRLLSDFQPALAPGKSEDMNQSKKTVVNEETPNQNEYPQKETLNQTEVKVSPVKLKK